MKIHIHLFAIILLWSSCIEPKVYPIIPEITFARFTIKDSVDVLGNQILLCKLTMTVKDGDGNIGLEKDDTLGYRHPDSLHYHNLFVKQYEKINGEFQEVELLIPTNYRTPFYETEGQNRALKADIEVKFEYLHFDYDTIIYDFFIYDRDLNQSDINASPELVPADLLNN
jgi:hypothetical protein